MYQINRLYTLNLGGGKGLPAYFVEANPDKGGSREG